MPWDPQETTEWYWDSNLSPTQFWVQILAQIWLENIAAVLQLFVTSTKAI